MDRSIREMVYGKLQLRSPWLSSKWRLVHDGSEIARIRRLGRVYTSVVTLPSGASFIFEPHGI